MLCSFLSISGRDKKTISSKKKGQSHAHDFDPDDPNLAPDLSEDVLTTESSMAGGASNQVNEDDKSDYEIKFLVMMDLMDNIVLKNMGVQEIHISVIWKMVHEFLSFVHKFSKMHTLGAS